MPKRDQTAISSGEDENRVDEVETGGAAQKSGNGLNMGEIMKNPLLMAAMQDKLQGLVGDTSGYIENLPKSIKNRINALKNIQVECVKLEGKFYEEAHQLEMKYAGLFEPLFQKRNNIVNAAYEPTEEECKFVEFGEEEEEEDAEEDKENTDVEKKVNGVAEEDEKMVNGVDEEEKKEENTTTGVLGMDENTKGIPEFWLTAMKNVDALAESIQPHDEAILKHVTDIQLHFTGRKPGEEASEDNPMGFMLEFHFSDNEFFTNKTLTKTYMMKADPDMEDPFSFDGPDIVGCAGCEIEWKSKEKNVTQKTVKKKQKHKGRKETRIVTKTVKNDSFFNFFSPPEVPEDEDDMDEDTEMQLSADYEAGHFFREKLIPKAVLYFTGEAIEEESDDEYEDEEDEDDEMGEGEDEDEEADPDFVPAPADGKQQDCKQQ